MRSAEDAAAMRVTLAVILATTMLAACGGTSATPDPTPAPDEFADPSPAGDDAAIDDGLGDLLDAGDPDAPIFAPDDASSTDAEAPPDAPASPPTCEATAKTGDYCGGDKVDNASNKTLYHCNGPGPATVVRKCADGCEISPGSDDYCKPSGPDPATCPHVSAVLVWGIHPIASDRLRCLGITAGRVTQTIGNATASAGTHAQDGTYDGHPYSAATDLSVSGLSDAQVRELLSRLDIMGFAAFYRDPGHDGWPSTEVRHIHAVFAGAAMKSSLQDQIADFLAGKNGLASHTAYTFYQPPADVKAYIKKIFDAAN